MKTKALYPTICTMLFFLLLSGFVLPQRIPTAISSAIENGDSRQLAQYFNSNVELVIVEQNSNYEEICSKAQAQMIVSNFFAKHKPSSFNIMHEGSRGSLVYATGHLATKNALFNVTFLLKSKGDNDYIHQLRFELNE